MKKQLDSDDVLEIAICGALFGALFKMIFLNTSAVPEWLPMTICSAGMVALLYLARIREALAASIGFGIVGAFGSVLFLSDIFQTDFWQSALLGFALGASLCAMYWGFLIDKDLN